MSTIATEVIRCPIHGIPDCSPLLNGCSVPNRIAVEVERIVAARLAAVGALAEQWHHPGHGDTCWGCALRAAVAADPAGRRRRRPAVCSDPRRHHPIGDDMNEHLTDYERGWRAALEWAADQFDRFDEVTIVPPEEVHIGSNMIPVAPAERLRQMADHNPYRAAVVAGPADTGR